MNGKLLIFVLPWLIITYLTYLFFKIWLYMKFIFNVTSDRGGRSVILPFLKKKNYCTVQFVLPNFYLCQLILYISRAF